MVEPTRRQSCDCTRNALHARTLAEVILARAADDWVSAAEVIDLVRLSGAAEPSDLRDLATGPVSRLILDGLVVAGDVDAAGHVPWPGSASDAIVRIVKEWSARTDPFVMPGEVFWLDTTAAGQSLGEKFWTSA